MEKKLEELKHRLEEVTALNCVSELLYWDQSTNMPSGGAAGRARHVAAVGTVAHERLTDPAIGRLLDELEPGAESLPYDSDDAALLRVARREYDRAVKVPADFVAQLSSHTADTYQVWAAARPENDFAKVRPYLERTLELSRQFAEYFAPYEHVADPLIDMADYGMKASTIRTLFAQLRAKLVPVVETITEQDLADDSCLHREFPEAGQVAFGRQIAREIGFDFDRGRLDKSPHPFTTSFAVGDVRITTRVDEHSLGNSLFSTIHEAGHGLYEQGVHESLDGTPLAGGTSSGVHESQSRLWENVIGRSRNFWEHYYPKLRQVFPSQLSDVEFDALYRAINKVERSLIRTEADEVTYNLHVMIRFDLELALLEGRLAVRDLPEAWKERYRADLGIIPQDDRDGVMQDVHWYGGAIGGAFQCYTLGNIMCGMFYQSALQAHPEIPSEIRIGKFEALHDWLRSNIYTFGSKYTAAELVERVTGGPIQIDSYITYLRGKYGELYDLA